MRDSLLIWGLLYESHYENKINKCHHQSDPVYNTLFSSSFFLNLAACWITACYRSSWFLFLFFTFFLEVKGGGCYLFPKSCNSACGFALHWQFNWLKVILQSWKSYKEDKWFPELEQLKLNSQSFWCSVSSDHFIVHRHHIHHDDCFMFHGEIN